MSETIDDLPVPRSEKQRGMGKGCTKYYPSDSTRKILKECFAENPATYIDPHQQNTGLNADQMIHFAGAVGLEVSLAAFAMLEDLLLKFNSKRRRSYGGSGGGIVQSPSLSRTVAESIASRLFF